MFDEPSPGVTQEERNTTIRVLQYERERMYRTLHTMTYEQACDSSENMDAQILGAAINYMIDVGQDRC